MQMLLQPIQLAMGPANEEGNEKALLTVLTFQRRMYYTVNHIMQFTKMKER